MSTDYPLSKKALTAVQNHLESKHGYHVQVNTCHICGAEADTIPGYERPICVECLFGWTQLRKKLLKQLEQEEKPDA